MAPDVRTKSEPCTSAVLSTTTTTHQAQSHGGLMLDARRATLQLPLMREVTALQKNLRTLQDPGTSSGSVTTSTSCSSGGHVHSKNRKKGKTQTFIGDPHQDAQALARELSGKLAKSALNGAPTRQHDLRIDKLQTKRRKSKTMTADDTASASPREMELGIRERIQRIESALDRSRPATVSGKLRKEGLIRKLKARRGQNLDMAQKEQSSLSQLLQGKNHDAGSTAAAPNLLCMVRDEEHRDGESLFESSDEQELSPMEREMSRPTPLTLRGEEVLKKPRSTQTKKKKPGSSRERSSIKAAAAPIILNDDDDNDVHDDELAVSELPNGVQWDWSRIPKYEDRAFRDLTGAHPKSSPKRAGHQMPDLHPPVQSISSLDSDMNALPLIIGADAHDSDLVGFYVSTVPRKSSGKRKASLQNAMKDVPGTSTGAPPYRTLTQKYRPKNFKEIVGQPVVVKSLSAAILRSKVAPVYLFMGPRGTGKTSAARVFAAGLNCLSLDVAARPCGICRECGTLALNRSADVRQIDAAASADLASMRATMGSFTPHARFKIFIVEGSDLLGTEVWNSFLKLLEEPPANVVFILITTEVDRIPATATSRCQKFQFLKLKEADIVKRLEFVAGREGLMVEADAFALIAMKADGSLRDAEIMLDQLCLLCHKTVSVSAVQELVGLLPDHKVLDLLDHSLSANTVNIVRTMREVLAAGVEPLALVSQLGALITDILVGSVDVDRENSSGFFSRKFSEKEEVHRLRHALKILSEAEKQLRFAADGATWLTAALLQFAPDRSFLPSDVNDTSSSAALSPGLAPNDPAIDEIQAALATVQEDAALEVENQTVITLSEQKLEEAWAGEPQAEDGGEPGASAVEFQVFQDEALAELWKRVLWEVTPRNLKNMLQTQGRLIAAGVAVDGSCAVVELEFDYARDKHKAERSWRSICISFQAVLSTAVELRIALSDAFPGESEMVRTAGDTPPSQSQPPSVQRPPPRRRGTRARRHRQATEMLQRELGAQFSSDVSGVTPRRPPPPSRRRRVKKKRAGVGSVKPAGAAKAVDHNSLTREIWDALSMDMKPEEKNLLRSMMQEPQSDIDNLHTAQAKILKQRNVQFRNEASGLTAVIDQRSSLIADLQRGLPAESSLVCWKRATPQSDFLMRKSRVKSVRKPQGKALFLRLVPCAATNVTAPPLPQLRAD